MAILIFVTYPIVLILLVCLLAIFVAVHLIGEKNKRDRAEEEMRLNRAKKERERTRKEEERDRTRILRAAERRWAAEEKERGKAQLAAEKRMLHVRERLDSATNIKEYVKAISYAQTELPNIKKQYLSSDSNAKYDTIACMTNREKADLFNGKIQEYFSSICSSAVSEMKSAEDFAEDLRLFFRYADDVMYELPSQTRVIVEEIRKGVGMD